MSNDRIRVNITSNQNSVEVTNTENKVIVTDKKQDTNVNVIQNETSVVTIVSKGPKGDRGEKGEQASLSGSVYITGSLEVSSSVTAQSFTGSLFGTASNALTASFITPTGTNAFVQGGNSFGTTALLGTNDNQNLRLETSGSVRMTISSSGNIGIGTTNPALGLLQLGTTAENPHANLVINAGVGRTSSITVRADNGFNLSTQKTYNPIGGSDSLNFIELLDADDITIANQPIGRIIFTSNDGDTNEFTTKAFIEAVAEDDTPDSFLAFGTNQSGSNTTERLRINSIGNVGIGTFQNISASLHISGANNNNLLRVSSPSSPFALFVSGSGNVGIGTTTPTNTLQVNGGITVTSVTSSTQGGLIAGQFTPYIRYNTNNIVASSSFGHAGAYMLSELGGVIGANDISFYAGAVTQPEIMRIVGSTGFVGIGTGAPTEKLHVNGNLLVTGRITAEEFHTEFVSASIIYQSGSTQFGNSSDDTHIFTGSLRVDGSITGSLFGTASNALTASFITPTGTNAFVQGGNSFGATALLGTNDNQNLQLETSGSVRVHIGNNGNVGIGTTSPTSTLQVNGSITATNLTVTNGSVVATLSPRAGSTGLLLSSNDGSDTRIFTDSITTGINSSDSAPYASAYGSGSKAIGTASFSEGIGSLASGFAAHAAGLNTTASGQAAFSVGVETDADGMASFAAGSGSWARGTATVAMGIGTIASASGQTVVGHYNLGLGDFNNLFVVGGGSGITTNLRKNLFRVYGGSGASTAGVEINTSPTQNTSTIDGFNVWGKTIFHSGVTGSSIDFNAVGVDGKTIFDPELGTITTGSFTSNFYRIENALGGGYEDVLKASVRLDHRGINFSLSEQTASPGSTFLWTNSSNRLFYGSNPIILNGGNTIGGVMTLGTNDNQNLQLETNNTTRVFISSSGNVGIGTATPIAQLHVTNSMLVNGTSDYFGGIGTTIPIQMFAGAANNGIGFRTDNFYLYPYGNNTSLIYGWNGNGAWTLRNLNTSSFQIYNNSPTDAVMLTVSSSGNVGIGTTTPSSRLEITHNSSGVAKFEKTSGAVGTILEIRGNTDDKLLSFWRAGVERAYIDIVSGNLTIGANNKDINLITGTGNVGIGETSPSARLEIRGSGATSATTALRVENSSAAASLVVLDDGAVGIGTTTPIARLHLSQSSGVFQRVDINNANADGVNATTQYYTNTGAAPDFFGATSFRLQGGTTDAFKQFQVYIANLTSPRFIINGSGNVGINTTSPNARLHISGANNEALLIASSSTAPSALFVSGSGNVGIGTTTPQRRLHIDASGSANTDIPLLLTSVDANNRVGIRFASSSLSAGRQHNLYHRNNSPLVEWILSSNSGESATWNFLPQDDTSTGLSFSIPRTTPGAIRIAAGINQSMLSLGASGSNQHLNISSSGNVGIGTTTPTSLLQVAGRVTSTELYVTNGDAIYTTNGSVGIGTSGPTSTNRLQVRGSGATSATTALRVENSAETARLTILDDGTSAFNTSHLYVSSSGNVGIGLTSPLARLHISGANALRMQNTGFDTFEWFFSAGTGIGFRNVTDGTTPFFVGGTDDIGIGTTNTSARLHVSGASNSNLLRVGSPASDNILFVTGSGRVGIGTTNPGVTLDVVGGSIRSDSTMFNSVTQTQEIRINSATFLRFLSASVETARYDNTGWGFFNTAPTAKVHISGANADNLFRVSSPSATNALFVSGSGNVGIGTTTPTTTLNVNGTTLLQGGQTTVRGSGATSATTALLVQNSTPTNLMTILDNGQFTYTTPTIILPASQSAYTISPIISASNVVGGQYYGVNITPTFFQTTGSQTETAFRVAATFTQSSAAATSGTNIIADFGASSVGSQFTITDVTSGSIYMVNDVSGLPIIEATSGWDVNIYNFPNTVFRKSGNNIELGVQSNTGSVLTFYADTILNEGYGFTYRTTQVSGSTSGAVTSSLWNITFGSVSSSVYVNAVVTGYDTASRDTITGDVKATIRYRSGVASIVGSNQSFSNTDNSDVSFNVVAGGTSGSLRVFGTGSRTYQWGATITTQVI